MYWVSSALQSTSHGYNLNNVLKTTLNPNKSNLINILRLATKIFFLFICAVKTISISFHRFSLILKLCYEELYSLSIDTNKEKEFRKNCCRPKDYLKLILKLDKH